METGILAPHNVFLIKKYRNAVLTHNVVVFWWACRSVCASLHQLCAGHYGGEGLGWFGNEMPSGTSVATTKHVPPFQVKTLSDSNLN